MTEDLSNILNISARITLGYTLLLMAAGILLLFLQVFLRKNPSGFTNLLKWAGLLLLATGIITGGLGIQRTYALWSSLEPVFLENGPKTAEIEEHIFLGKTVLLRGQLEEGHIPYTLYVLAKKSPGSQLPEIKFSK